jgi:hypothetical protein
MYVNTHVGDASREAEYHNWYRDVHFPDVTEPGIFVNASMFHNASTPPQDGEGKFLAFYETFWSDIEAASLEFAKTVEKLRVEKRIHAGTLSASFGIYRQHAIVFGTERRKRSQSVLAVMIDCLDPAKLAALREWYAEKHIPDIIDVGLYHTGSLNEIVSAAPFAEVMKGQARFLALYESDIGDPHFLAGELVERFGAGGPPEYVEIRGASNFYRADG